MGNPDELSQMKDKIQDMAKDLGMEIEFDQDAELAPYRRGDRLLKYGELQEGMVVWGSYQEHGETEPEVSGPFRLEQGAGNSFILEDGSSFCLDIEVGDPEDECREECCEGVKLVHEAVPR